MPRDVDHVWENELVSEADSVREDTSLREDVLLRAIPSLTDVDRPTPREVLRDRAMLCDCPADDCDPFDRLVSACILWPRAIPTRVSFRGCDGWFGLLVDGRYC